MKKLVLGIGICLTIALVSFTNKDNKNATKVKTVPPGDSIIHMTACTHYLDGNLSNLTTINAIPEGGITQVFTAPNDEQNVYWFTSKENFLTWIDNKPYKQTIINDLNQLEIASNEPCPECENLLDKGQIVSPKAVGLTVGGTGIENSDKTGRREFYYLPHKTLHSFNNQISISAGRSAWPVDGWVIWCTKTKFKGTQFWQSAFVGDWIKFHDLSGTSLNDNFESIF